MSWNWHNVKSVGQIKYNCGHCGAHVGPSDGYFADWKGSSIFLRILICPSCEYPTFFDRHKNQTPSQKFGEGVAGVDDANISNLYDEARSCMQVNAYTASVMASRKLLMNISVNKGAPSGQSFVQYVDYLEKNGWMPPNGREWVDSIRKKGNEANHEIHLMTQDDAEELLGFVEMLLKFIFEFPAKIKKQKK